MAKKGQKFKKYPDELKEQVISDYFDSKGGVCILSKKYNISPILFQL